MIIEYNIFAKIQNYYELSATTKNIFRNFAKNLNFIIMKKSIFMIFIMALAVIACGHQPKQPAENLEKISTYQQLSGDSAIYGLACDGCTDSILILLPYSGGDPDTFDILSAREANNIFGRPRIGDELSVMVNPDSTKEATMVINVSRLMQQWAYMVTPTLRTSLSNRPIPDSIKKRLMVPREYGLRLKRDHSAQTIGIYRNSNRPSPAIYPVPQRYSEWQLCNGLLLLRTDTIDAVGARQESTIDTVSIVLLRRDTLVLRFADHEQGYYLKKQ